MKLVKQLLLKRKDIKRTSNNESQNQKINLKDSNFTDDNSLHTDEKTNIEKKSSVVLKPLSKDEQKKILKADSKKEKNQEIEKIRLGKHQNNLENQNLSEENEVNVYQDSRSSKKEPEKKKNFEVVKEVEDKKKSQNTFGRKKIRERKVTIVTALSDIDERTRSLAAYKKQNRK